MKMTLIKLMIILPTTMTLLKTPMSMGFMLILQTMFTSLLLNKILQSSWFMMITFLMMIGGLLILFMYMCSIASNEKFKLNLNLTFVLIIIIMSTDEMLFENQNNEFQNMVMSNQLEKFSMIKLYNEKSMIITMLMVMYLLLTMISVSKIVKLHKGPLRKKTYE
uniref:NADH-ubiquinone oxidoreductase chain 6 n=1 Tax=Cicadella viridis TaxID=36150 RepID=A0A343X9P9_CICVR|nr:NADH dehydrogenase subunit 6 [Cicadella viridis]